MSVLSDRQVWELLESGQLTISPRPAPEAVSPSAVDLTLASDFKVPRARGAPAARIVMDTRGAAAVMAAIPQFSEEVVREDGEPFVMEPGAFVLAWTREEIHLPDFLSARVEGRSTLARLGLSVHQSAPTVHATFRGRLQLEMTNAGPFTLELFPGQPVCQLILEEMSRPATSVLQSVHQAPDRV